MTLALPTRRAALLAPPWAPPDLWRRAQSVPSLDLRFAERKDLIDVISGLSLITYTRAGSATFVGSGRMVETAGTNVPRFDHNPTTGESLGLLVEEQRTNLLLHSRTLTNVAWVATNITPAKDETGADGVGNSASSITATAADGTILQTVTSASAARATTAYVRRITGSGAIEMTQNGGTTWTAITVTSSWSRVSIPSATVTNPSVGFRIATSGDAIAVDYVQCETGTFVTSAIETTTAAVTRSADVVSITGTNFSSWYRQDEGTIYADVVTTSRGHNSFPRLVAFLSSDVNSTNAAQIFTRNVGALDDYKLLSGFSDGVVPAVFDAPVSAPFGEGRAALAIKADDAAYSVNGSAVLIDTSCAVPTPIQARLFGQARFQPNSSGYIRRLTYWPQRLSNSILQTLTR